MACLISYGLHITTITMTIPLIKCLISYGLRIILLQIKAMCCVQTIGQHHISTLISYGLHTILKAMCCVQTTGQLMTYLISLWLTHYCQSLCTDYRMPWYNYDNENTSNYFYNGMSLYRVDNNYKMTSCINLL